MRFFLLLHVQCTKCGNSMLYGPSVEVGFGEYRCEYVFCSTEGCELYGIKFKLPVSEIELEEIWR